MGIKIKNLQTGEFEKFNIPALKGEKGEPGEIEPSEKVDYIGKQHSKLRDTMNANVNYIVKTAIGEFNYLDYEGQYITATNSIEGHAKSAILKGQTLVNIAPNMSQSVITSGTSPWKFAGSGGVVGSVSDNKIKISNTNDGSMIICGEVPNTMKPSTKYYVQVEVKNNSSQNLYFHKVSTNSINLTTGLNKFIITTVNDLNVNNMSITMGNVGSVNSGTEFEFSKLMIIEYQQGMENWDIPYFEGVASCKMPILHTVGKNLFNYLDNEKLCVYAGGNVRNEDHTVHYAIQQSTINVTEQPISSNLLGYKLPLKHTESITISATGLGSTLYYRYYGEDFKTLSSQSQRTKAYVTTNNVKSVTIPFSEYPSQAEYIFLGIGNTAKSDYVIDNLQIEYGESATSYELHKSSILSCNILDYHEDKILLNKNLSPDGVAISNFNGRAIVYQVPAKGGTVYHTSTIANNVKESWYAEYDSNKNVITTRTQYTDTFTTKANTAYVSFFYVTGLESNALNSKAQVGYMLCEDEVILRSLPNGVCDTFNTRTGVYTQRIGEVVLNGSEDWTNRSIDVSSDTVITYSVIDLFNYGFQKTSIHCDKYATLIGVNGVRGAQGVGYGDKECLWLNHQQTGQSPYVYINIAKAKLSDTSLNTFKSYLQSNPITVQYELETPIIKTVDLSDNVVYSYKGTTHYSCSSEEGSLVPTLSVKVPTDTQLTIQEQKATTQTLLIKNMDLQQSIKEVQAMNLAFNTALYNSFNSIREEVEDIKKHVSTNENLEGSF